MRYRIFASFNAIKCYDLRWFVSYFNICKMTFNVVVVTQRLLVFISKQFQIFDKLLHNVFLLLYSDEEIFNDLAMIMFVCFERLAITSLLLVTYDWVHHCSSMFWCLWIRRCIWYCWNDWWRAALDNDWLLLTADRKTL